MKFNLPFLGFLLIQVSLHAQLGFHGGIQFPNHGVEYSGPEQQPGNGIAGYRLVGRHRLRLPAAPNTRIEFLPELHFAAYQADVIDLGDLDARFYSGFLNVNVYLLDLKGDCDCPTWSKSGNTLTKGLFLQLSPGYSLIYGNVKTTEVLYKGRSTESKPCAGRRTGPGGFQANDHHALCRRPVFSQRHLARTEESIARDISIGDRVTHNESPLTLIYAGIHIGVQNPPVTPVPIRKKRIHNALFFLFL